MHSFKSPPRSPLSPPFLHHPSFLSFSSPARRFSPHLQRRSTTRRGATRSALHSHDVTRVGTTVHRYEKRVPASTDVSGPNREEGRDSFEPRLVFASPCVPRTSYFNETVCLCRSLSFSFFSFAPFCCSPRLLFALSLPLSRSWTNRPTGPLSSRMISSLTVSFSLSPFPSSPYLSLSLCLSACLAILLSCSLISRGFFPSSPCCLFSPPIAFVHLSKKRRTAFVLSKRRDDSSRAIDEKCDYAHIRTILSFISNETFAISLQTRAYDLPRFFLHAH